MYRNEFNQETRIWGGRDVIPATSELVQIQEMGPKEKLSVLTYNVLRQMDATTEFFSYCTPGVLNIEKRQTQVLRYSNGGYYNLVLISTVFSTEKSSAMMRMLCVFR